MERTEQSSTSKRHKVSEGDQNQPLIDRLSGLPDSVLCYILSFLPTEVAVATSILARRWRLLWTGVSNLNLKFYKTFQHKERCSDIISRVMMLHNAQNLNLFYLHCYDCSEYQLETWLTTAIARKVRNTNLFFPYKVNLPAGLFTCRTLVDMKLQACQGIPFPGVVSLPSLKKLNLYYFRYKNDETLPHLISGCPVLQKLVINGVMPQDLIFCNISSPTIKQLTVRFQFYSTKSNRHDYRVVINAPGLRYLEVEDSLSEHISAHMLNSLTGASICLQNEMAKEDDIAYSNRVLEFVDKLYNVDSLKLSIGYAKFLDSGFSASTLRFHNLTKLELGADWRFLLKFLQYADNLKDLVMLEVDTDLKCWKEPEQVPTCLLSHLTTITIDKFGHEENEFAMVRYLLKNARVLRRMEIESNSDDLHDKHCALKIISLFKRGSEACELAFR